MQIDGRSIANKTVAKLRTQQVPSGYFAVMVVGNNPATESFVRQKQKVAQNLGVDFRITKLPNNTTTNELQIVVEKLAQDSACNAVVVQLPLPGSVNTQAVLDAIPSEKDVDVLSSASLGAFYTENSAIAPPAVGTTEKILEYTTEKAGKKLYNWLSSQSVALIGAGPLVGKPLITWLTPRAQSLSVYTVNTPDVAAKLQNADIIISGAGAGHLFGPEHIKETAIIIDFGITRKNSKLIGDFNPASSALRPATNYTPTPGGTGPILVAQLFENYFISTLSKAQPQSR